MTLFDLLKLMRRYVAVIVVIPIVFALITAGFMLAGVGPANYSADAHIVTGTSAQLSTLNGTASSAAREYSAANAGYKVSVRADTASLTVTVTVECPDESEAVSAANEVAASAVKGAKDLLGEDKIAASVERAAVGSNQQEWTPFTVLLVAVLAGLFAAICAVVGIDAVKNPVKGPAELEAASNLPVLGMLPGDTGERLLANVRFASGASDPRNVIVVPAQNAEAATLVSALVEHAVQSEESGETACHGGSISISASAPLSQGISAVYQAREADAVLIACAQWADSRGDVESTVAELNLAGANVVGCVLVKDTKRTAAK